MGKLTPMMQQYMEIKENYKTYILFFRLGDFYEMFFEDAKIAVKVLGIALTGRDCGLKERAPMAGIPHHAADNYIQKLVEAGYHVAICEQVEDPKDAVGIVKRAVTRIVTPGTVDTDKIEAEKNNFILAFLETEEKFALATTDLSTGYFAVTILPDYSSFLDELVRMAPTEIISPTMAIELQNQADIFGDIEKQTTVKPAVFDPWVFDLETAKKALKSHFKVPSLTSFGLSIDAEISVAGGLLAYLHHTQQGRILHIEAIKRYYPTDFMHVDKSTRRHLEITETLWEQQKKGSLLGVLDHTKTPMGARKLRKWITEPLLEVVEIEKRLETVEVFFKDPLFRDAVKESLSPILDMERLISKITYKTANGRDLLGLLKSMEKLPPLHQTLSTLETSLGKELVGNMDLLEDIRKKLEEALLEDVPHSIREGNIFKKGYDEALDTYRAAKENGNNWLLALEEKEIKETGIKNLKIKYNRIFGYFLEVTKSYLNLVPGHYQRKQTLANSERYTIEALHEIEEAILGANEKMVALEYDLFLALLDYLTENIKRIQETADILAIFDVLQSFGETADRNNYVKPLITQEETIDIQGSRHPVVEQFTPHFVSNDVYIGGEERKLLLLTGPNMSGKSTYMRQVALIVLMAQCGSFIPATAASIGIVDRIFTRIGASDNLSMGQSTFMVEMNEMANILHHTTARSLLILDEIGRGTSTYDGLSIAWAILEYIVSTENLKPKTFFATHYHELTDLEKHIPGVKNLSVSVMEEGEDIIFLHKIEDGTTNRSYGIQVAELAGLPGAVIKRAKAILEEMVEEHRDLDLAHHITKKNVVYYQEKTAIQTVDHGLLEAFLKINVHELSPLEVSMQVKNLQSKEIK